MLVLPAVLTHVQAGTCLAMLLEAARRKPKRKAAGCLVVDASALESFDSSALAVLLACRREALRQQRGFAVKGLPLRLRTLAVLYGTAPLLCEAPLEGEIT